jgi:predicted transcriptional regulator
VTASAPTSEPLELDVRGVPCPYHCGTEQRRSAVTAIERPLSGRRRSGSLEQEILAVLWSAEHPLTPREVQRAIDSDLAYTTVMTILSRLHAKGLVERSRSGRAYAYSPFEHADDHAAQAMTEVLSGGVDRTAVLSRFVERLGPEEEAVLRRLLDRG